MRSVLPCSRLYLPSSLLNLLILVVSGLFFTGAAYAQVAFNGVETTVVTGATQYQSVAVDGSGNIYEVSMVEDTTVDPSTQTYSLIKLTHQADGSYQQTTLATAGLGDAILGVAVDTAGDVYYTQFYSSTVVELTPSGSGYSSTTLPISVVTPIGIAVDGSGNLYVTSYNGGAVYKETLSGGSYTQSEVVSGLTYPQTPWGLSVDAGGTVYIGFVAGNSVLLEVPVGDGTYTPTSVSISGYSNPSPYQAVADGQGNVYIIDAANSVVLKETLSNGSYTQSLVTGDLSTPNGLTLDVSGNLYVANANITSVQLTSAPFVAQAVQATAGTSTGTLALPFTVFAGTTVGSVSVVTTGVSGRDFVDAGASTCVAQTYSVQTACVVNVNFTPLAPGLRRGAVVIADGSGNVLASLPVYGTGYGPQTVFGTGTTRLLAQNTFSPSHLTVDAAGNVYFVTQSGASKLTPSGGQIQLSTGYSSGVALDGAGNAYVDSYDSNYIQIVQPNGTQTSVPNVYTGNQDIALDGAGNLYLATGGGVDKVTPTGVRTTLFNVYPGGFSTGVAVDAAGNVYVSDSQNNSVYKVTPEGVTTTVVSGLGELRGIALDAAGNVYVSENDRGIIDEVSPAGVVTQLTTGANQPYGVAVDDSGNVYYVDRFTNSIYEIVRSTPPSLTFADTQPGATSTDSPQTVTVQNTGNSPLLVRVISYSLDFPQDPSGVNPCVMGTPVAVGSSCGFTVDFTPVTVAPSGMLLNEGVGLSTNYAPALYQSIPVSGMELAQPPTDAPVFSPPAGTYTDTQNVTLSSTTPGAQIAYSLNGSALKLYTGPIAVRSSSTLYAIAGAASHSLSSFVSAQYNLVVATPVLSPAPGTYADAQTVTITSASSHAILEYITNGPSPVTAWTRVTGPIAVNATQTIRVRASQTGYAGAPLVIAAYNIQSPPAVPVISLPGGTYSDTQSVTISESVPGAKVYYTLNGTTPTSSSYLYTGPVAIRGSVTLKAIALAPGYDATAVASASYSLAVATPVLTPAPGTYISAQTVSITCASSGALLEYAVTGTNPSIGWTRYTGPISASSTQTIKVRASQTGFSAASPVAGTYYIQSPPVLPTFSVAAGTYDNMLNVSIFEPVSGVKVYYTLNGATPTSSSFLYTGPVAIRNSATLKAIAVAPGYDPTGVASAQYALAAATPVFSIASGTYSGSQTVTVSSDTASAILVYTTNGQTPTGNSTRYTGPISIQSTKTLKVLAIATGYANSPIVSATYTIQ